MKRIDIVLVMMTVVIAIIIAAVLIIDDPGVDDDPVAPVDPYPAGVRVDVEKGTVTLDYETDWHVFDLLEYNCILKGDSFRDILYEGYDVTAKSITLTPGYYELTVEGETFRVVIEGDVTKTSEWNYNLDGTVHEVSVSYDIDISSLAGQYDESSLFNDSNAGRYDFSDLPGLVVVDDDIRVLESSLRAEFTRIGGDPKDVQAYADFLASFPQLAIDYPQRLGHGEDYVLYGQDEYWAMPLETLYKQYGDCEDTSILLCALYEAAGYVSAVGGMSGHVFAGVALDHFEETSEERLDELDKYRPYKLAYATPVEGFASEDVASMTFYAVETIWLQAPVGYLTSGMSNFGMNTFWGISGFYPVQGADPGIQGSE